MKSKFTDYPEFFKTATGNYPYPYQQKLVESDNFPEIIEVPTGLGKTDAIILGWIWRRQLASNNIRKKTPRRLLFCLPMRVLVEQTRDKVEEWLRNLNLLGNHSETDGNRISVTVLMGGEDKQYWDLYPERDAIIIGTQDMLLSRALNRGYGMSRYRWPTHFGLLNNDCLWVMDEIQLMGKGLSTTIQLQAFRKKIGTIDSLPVQSVWMSATLDKDWLKTVDFDPQNEINSVLKLGDDDYSVPNASKRLNAIKILKKAEHNFEKPNALAKEIISRHKPGTRTLIVVNTVKRATDLFDKIEKEKPAARTVLIHSRFRPSDRKKVVESLLEKPDESGTIIVSTQVVEAGVDVSANILFTELAPWSSLVQRFGRCNRYGEYENAEIYWIEIPSNKSPPYEEDELSFSLEILSEYEEKCVGPANLPNRVEGFVHRQIIRKKEIYELFDTTPDLTGSDIDISRYIRESDNLDFSVFWRDIDYSRRIDESLPYRDELCPAPLTDVKELIKNPRNAYTWDHIDGEWKKVTHSNEIYPGVTVMLDAKQGGYTDNKGWDVKSKKKVDVISHETSEKGNAYSDNSASVGRWESIAEHTDTVCKEMESIISEIELRGSLSDPLMDGVRWHDAGKAHHSFQASIIEEELEKFPTPPAAKAPKDAWKSSPPRKPGDDGRRIYFRHELASGILALQNNRNDLAAYLAASHHGKVRGSIRSMPDEFLPPDKNRRFARGVWEGDIVPETDLGGGIRMPKTEIDLSYMDLGEGRNGPSWAARVLKLRDSPEIGPFRLAFMEALMKAADERASGGGKND